MDGERAPPQPYPPRLAVSSWEPNYCVANLYRTGEDFTGIHSDPLTQLGPQCIIGSLSLGRPSLSPPSPFSSLPMSTDDLNRNAPYHHCPIIHPPFLLLPSPPSPSSSLRRC
jgi:hypothetical protein